ncbi:AAA family ATPase [Roseivirga sp.]|uniref:AAA family ATPase n=1 Tax=Roseivirga sp. TaxID=1964215 RepID=UPI003B520160
MNPFLLKGYISSEFFCDREEETDKIVNSIRNQQDITVHSIRRMGKSSLLKHVEQALGDDCYFIYVDIWGSSSVSELLKELSNGVIRSSIFSSRGFGKKLQDFVKSLGTSFTLGLDGRPSVDIVYNDRISTFKSLEEIIAFLNNQDKRVVLAIDEFQEVKKYGPDSTPIEATFRKLTQQSHNITFIYSGSEQHLINEIFNTYDRPFFQSTRMIHLGAIDKEKYQAFILEKFNSGKKQISDELVSKILDATYRHTYYVQATFNYLYSLRKVPKTWNEFEQVYYPYIDEKGVFYAELPDRITPQQFVVTKAFARFGRVYAPTGNEFLQFAGFTNSSSMLRVINALLSKQIIIKEEDSYRLYDVFLEHYLKYNA